MNAYQGPALVAFLVLLFISFLTKIKLKESAFSLIFEIELRH